VLGWTANNLIYDDCNYHLLTHERQEKINCILNATVKVLAQKGYEQATIADISKVANVARGALHYYFKDKEDLVTKALANCTTSMVQSSLEGLKGESPEQIVDNVINVQKNNISENPDFFSFLYEMWCAGRRSKKIKKEFLNCQDKVIAAIKGWLDNSAMHGTIKINVAESEAVSRALLGITDGMAFELIDHPEKLNDKNTWAPFKMMMLAVLED
jgi:AcrR family transcriptional regulator